MTHFRFPKYWWGARGTGLEPPTHSVLDLLDGRVLDAGVAALFWSLFARRASVLLVGSYARGEGKTTTLSALTGFFPADTELVVTRGVREDFTFLQAASPDRTYVMVGEFSDHTPAYLWGQAAARVWRLTAKGYRFAGTMHADSVEDVVRQVGSPPVSLGTAEIAQCMQLAIFLRVSQDGGAVRRRITSANWFQPVERGPGGLGAKSLVAWNPATDGWTLFSSPDTWADLAQWGGTAPDVLREEVHARADYLAHLQGESPRDFDTVRERLLAFPG